MARFFKTTFTVEVLSEGEFDDGLNLEQIAHAIDHGECVGRFTSWGMEPLSPKEMADDLTQYGSEPGFFQLDDNGEPI